MAEFSEYRLDRDLDTWWNRLTAHEASPPEPEPLRADIATVRYLDSHHTAPNPDPAFVRNLKTELMAQAKTSAAVTATPTAFAPTAPARVRPIFWREQRQRIWGLIELTAVAALILMFLGAASGDGPFGGLNSVWQQPDEGSGEVGMYRGNAARTGVASDPGPSRVPELKWKQRFHAIGNFGYRGVAVVAGERIYLSQDQRGEVVSVDAATGKLIWTATVGKIADCPPAVGNGFVFVATAGPDQEGDGPGYLVALDAQTGAERWRYETGGCTNSSPAISDQTVYVNAAGETLRAVNAQTGREQWRSDLSLKEGATGDRTVFGIRASPAVAQAVVYTGNEHGTLIALDALDGHELWRFQSDGNVIYTPAIVDGTAYFTAFKTNEFNPARYGWVYAVDAASGQKRWSVEAVDQSQSAPAVADGLIFLGSTGEADVTDSSFTALDAKTGDRVWTYPTSGLFTSNLIYADGTVYGTSDLGGVFALDPRSGDLIWRADTSKSLILAPSVIDGLVIVPATDGTIFAIGSAQTGATPPADPSETYNVSGLSICNPPRSIPTREIPGTPTATLFPGRDRVQGEQPQVLISEAPEGSPASNEAVAGILKTMQGMADCDRPLEERTLRGFVTDDFLRRNWVTDWEIFCCMTGAWQVHDSDSGPATTFDDARVLPDGRVGITLMTSDTTGFYVIFAEINGDWLIDERYDIVENLRGASGSCIPPRDITSINIPGTPTTLIPLRESQGSNLPEILLEEIPEGAPPSDEATAGILKTLRDMEACVDDWQAQMDFYSDDYLRRAAIGSDAGYGGYYAEARIIRAADGGPATSFDEARALRDGRVAVVIMTNDQEGSLVIFAEHDGYWLIDERFEIVPRLGMNG
jgi:outer membrane protein assembly factor BamB